jgi:tRNA-intron endonuclease
MDGRLRDGEVVVGGDARQRFHDARGYGRPLGGGEMALAPVEAAHLLFRGDLDAVDGVGFREFVAHATDAEPPGFVARFLVYADFRDRGFYLSPTRDGRAADADPNPDPAADAGVPFDPDADLVVYPRGKGPGDGEIAYRVRVVGERASVPAADLGGVVLAVVDEESEITYLDTGEPAMTGEGERDGDDGNADRDGSDAGADLPGGVDATLLDDRVVAWEPPAALHGDGFYGQPVAGRDADVGALQLSLVEAAYLAAGGLLALDADAVRDRGRAVEGERFDRRLAAYRALRDAGLVPKTGFKFGADFRVYRGVASPEEVGHSAHLVRVLPRDHAFAPRDLALDVRLAHGVRKRMVFALTDGGADESAPDRAGDVRWLSVERLTP